MTLADRSSAASDASNPANSSESFGVQWSLEETLTFIARCYDRDALLDTLLGFSQRCLSNRMMLLLGNRQAKSYRLQGWADLDPRFRQHSALSSVKVELAEDAAFFDETPDDEAQLSYAHARRPEEIGIDQLFVELTLFPPERVVFQTVYIGHYPAIALLGEPLKDVEADLRRDLQRCARAVGEQLSELLQLTRSGKLPPAEKRIPPPPNAAPRAAAASPFEPDGYPSGGAGIPGLVVESSVSEEIPDPHPGATAYGLPFANSPEAATDPQQAAAPAADLTPSEDILPEPEDVVLNPRLSMSAEAKHSTLEGGFTVHQFAPFTEDDGAKDRPAHLEDTGAHDLAARREEVVDEQPREEDAEEPGKSRAPKAQILRHVSLKAGRRTGRNRAGASAGEAAQTAPQTSPGAIPHDILTRFPGPLQVDRYQYSVATLPPVDAHGPMLAKLVAGGAESVHIARHFLDHISIEVRFYATYLFSQLPTDDTIELLLERLFDRDQQTRELAKQIVLAHYRRTRARGEDWLGARLRPFLHAILASEGEDLRTEVAADLLAALRDAPSVDILIAGLDRFHGRIKDSVFGALQAITYLDFAPASSDWRQWRALHPRGSKTDAQERGEWIVQALNAPSVLIREMVFEEIQQFDRLDLNYHPNQPEKLRARAQEDLRHWLTLYAPE